MAGQTTTNATAVKLGSGFLGASAAAAKSTTVVDDAGRLPAGIENGVARIVAVKIMPIGAGKQNAGKPMFNAQAVVVKPEYHDGVRIAGRRTSMMENLFDTPGKGKRQTTRDHVEHVYAYLRMWGIDTNMFAACKTEQELKSKLDAAFAVLVKKKACVSFRTWKGQATPEFPNPRVNETWGGLAQVAPDAAPSVAVQDDSPPAEDSDVPPDADPDDDVGAGDTGDEGGDAGTGLTDEEVDALVAVADGEEGQDKDDAGVRLEDWCKETCPAVADDLPSAPDWATAVEWARAGGKPADDEPGVAVGAVVEYRVPSGGPGKPAKTVQCEVKKVYKVKGADVADVLNQVDKKTQYKAVPFDKLKVL